MKPRPQSKQLCDPKVGATSWETLHLCMCVCMYIFSIHLSSSAQLCAKTTLEIFGLLYLFIYFLTFVKTLKMNVVHFSKANFHFAVIFQWDPQWLKLLCTSTALDQWTPSTWWDFVICTRTWPIIGWLWQIVQIFWLLCHYEIGWSD